VQPDLQLRESATLAEGAVQPDGTLLMHLLRPCIGRGRGAHLYEASMLQRDAGVMAGWRMFVDHLSPEAQRKAGGMPRSVRDLGGRVIESWWDGTVPADPKKGFGRGAVMGKVRPVKFVREMVEDDPEIVESSINATATGVKPVVRDGRRVLLVEGIAPKGSVDWVTEAGAGGRVVSLMEAAYGSPDDEEAALLEAMTDEEFRAYVAEHRPDLLEAVAAKGKPPKGGAAEDEADGGADDAEEGDDEALVKKLMARGLPRSLAVKAAARQKAAGGGNDGGGVQEAAREDDDVAEITPEVLQEALASDAGQAMIRAIVENAVEETRDAIRAETTADSDRKLALREMALAADAQVNAARLLPEPLKEQVRARFSLQEGRPTPALDACRDVLEDGKVTKSAAVVLQEAVAHEIKEAADLYARLNPTRVRGQGPAVGEDDADKGKQGPPRVGALTAHLLQEAGFEKPDEVFAINGAAPAS
jgi:hypothetical protein